MQYALIKHYDGTVEVMALLPQTWTAPDGNVLPLHRLERINDTVVAKGVMVDGRAFEVVFPAAVFDAGGEAFGYVSVEECLAKWHPSKRSEVESWRPISPADIPGDRTFRDAWCDVTPEPMVDIDMSKARAIQRSKLRELRAPTLAALDIEFMRAVEVGDSKALFDIAAKKQALRDVTADPAIEAATTPEELKAVIPAVLKQP